MTTIAICILIARVVITCTCVATNNYDLLVEKTGISYIVLGLFAALNVSLRNENIERVLDIAFPEYLLVKSIYNLF